MFDKIVNKILEGYLPTKVPITQGPNIDFTGSTPAGFLGGGLPGINPSASIPLKIKKKKKRLKKKA
jgi:hypothetical protein